MSKAYSVGSSIFTAVSGRESTAIREINQAAHDAGSYWYTAWLNADRPELPTR